MENSCLYHYTNIKTLKTILDSGKIRFSSLTNVDDKNEELTADFGNFGRFCYVSCWTDIGEESIPVWKMYTTSGSGVRIKMPKNMFMTEKGNPISDRNIEKIKKLGMKTNIDSFTGMLSTTGICDIEQENKVYFPNRFVELFPVTYTKDRSLIHQKISKTQNNMTELRTDLIGKFKDIEWEFQSEWRYKLFAFPYGVADLLSLPAFKKNPMTFFSNLAFEEIRYDYFDIPFDKDLINKIEITTDCMITEESMALLNSLKAKYPGIKVIKSSLNYR